MRVAGIHQPQYLPWLGLIDRASKCDIFVILDNVPYSKNYFYNRNQIKGPNGNIWLTVPMLTKGYFGQTFLDARIDNNQDWRVKHWKSIRYSYSAAPFFKDYRGYFEEVFAKEWKSLVDICLETFRFLLKSYGVTTSVVRASELGVSGKKEELIINICKKLDATHYLSGPDGKNYLDLSFWKKNNVRVDFQNYSHPIYPQLHGDFAAKMSSIDLLFNCGNEGLKILTAGQPEYFLEGVKK